MCKKVGILLSVVLLVVSLLNYPTFSSASPDYSYKIGDSLNEKISEMAEDDLVPLNIYLASCNKENLNKNLIDKYDVDMEVFENPSRFYAEVIPNIKIDGIVLKNTYKESELTRENLDLDNKQSTISVTERKRINLEINKTADYYIECYRKESTMIVGAYLDQFLNRNSTIIKEIIFRPSASEFLIAKVSKKDIPNLISDSVVKEINCFENQIQENCSWNATSVTKSDDVTGLGSSFFNAGSGYDGTGIKIGIIEAEKGKYDPNNYNFTNANISFVSTPGVSGETTTDHATRVSALICGKHVTISGKHYGGAANGATVYQTGISNYVDVLEAIEMFYSMGVNVVNYSGGSNNNANYTDYDRQVDQLIHDYHISMINIAGNTSSNVISPGKAYNVITVGNLKTKNTSNGGLSAPYSLNDSSSYVEASYLTNKPDVVAPGTYIYLPSSSTTATSVGSGTSYSAPVVTAIVAQLMQSCYIARFNPYLVKSYLCCAASNDSITGITPSYGKLMNETGAGLVNAIRTYNVSTSGNEFGGMYLSSATPTVQYDTKETIYLQQGDRIRIAMAFQKAENIGLTAAYGNDIDIRLISSSGANTYCALGSSKKNNVEIIDEVVPATGYYYLQMRLWDSIIQPGTGNELRYWMSWRIE